MIQKIKRPQRNPKNFFWRQYQISEECAIFSTRNPKSIYFMRRSRRSLDKASPYVAKQNILRTPVLKQCIFKNLTQKMSETSSGHVGNKIEKKNRKFSAQSPITAKNCKHFLRKNPKNKSFGQVQLVLRIPAGIFSPESRKLKFIFFLYKNLQELLWTFGSRF